MRTRVNQKARKMLQSVQKDQIRWKGTRVEQKGDYYVLKIVHLAFEGWTERYLELTNRVTEPWTAIGDTDSLNINRPVLRKHPKTPEDEMLNERIHYHVRRLRSDRKAEPDDRIVGDPEEIMRVLQMWNNVYIAAGRFNQPRRDPRTGAWSGVQAWIIPGWHFGGNAGEYWTEEDQLERAVQDFQRIAPLLYFLDGAPWTIQRFVTWFQDLKMLQLFQGYWLSASEGREYKTPRTHFDPEGMFQRFLDGQAASKARAMEQRFAPTDFGKAEVAEGIRKNALRILDGFVAALYKREDERTPDALYTNMLEFVGYESGDQKQFFDTQTSTMQAILTFFRASVDRKPVEDAKALWLFNQAITYRDFIYLLIVLLARHNKKWAGRIFVRKEPGSQTTQADIDRVVHAWPCVYDGKSTYSKLPADETLKLCGTPEELQELLLDVHPEMRHLRLSTALIPMMKKKVENDPKVRVQEPPPKKRRLRTHEGWREAARIREAQQRLLLPPVVMHNIHSYMGGKPRVQMFKE